MNGTAGGGRPGGLAIARRFLRFFADRGHTVVPSASLVPAGDPTLLFTNAGMVQFKDVFLGLEQRSYVRAATVQRCLRVSGKHNDLETVGPSPYHHTLFFMLGNFSFGDYFKREAIPYAWEFVTRDLAIPPERLVTTIFTGDEEALGAWRALGVPEARILQMGEKTNFWSMGDVGPCGPTSELHYDWGPEACTCGRPDCSVALDNGCARWLEIWNLVFMQYNQAADGARTRLPKPGVDTGMGLERIASVVAGVRSTYETDLFTPIMDRVQALLGHTDAQRRDAVVPYRVIADHGRAAAFLLADGVTPGNEGRAYVLRMIMRRAIRFGRRAGFLGPFLADVAGVVIDQFGGEFEELVRRREFILRMIEAEEERFAQTLSAGLERLAEVIAATRARGERTLAGGDVFRLYDTYGFPVEMTRDVAAEEGLGVDEQGFRAAMEEQRRRSRAAGAADEARMETVGDVLRDLPPTTFVGYSRESARASILAVLRDGVMVDEAGADEEVVVVLDRTPFYAEAGGQVGDAGRLVARGLEVEITDTRRLAPGLTGHTGRIVRGRLRRGGRVRAEIDGERRAAIRRNHTATHLLHRALHDVLGEHARQAGSLVAPDRLRFDFTHAAAVSPEEREAIERRVNEMVLAARPVRAREMPLAEARRLGAMALFGEKYGERVRVVEVEGISRELCGGTHLGNTGEIGLFLITAESSAASGIRRIEAVTGWGAYERVRAHERLIAELSAVTRVAPGDLVERIGRLIEQAKAAQRAPDRAAPASLDSAIRVTAAVDGVSVVVARIDGATHDALREAGDRLRDRAGVVVLAGSTGERINLVTMASPEAVARGVRADAVLRAVAAPLGGAGGGRPDMAQGGGREVARLDEVLDSVPEHVRRLLEAG
ncbi:MAG: alanine--tRNA ligase [Armatimonadota bacterium]|nr:alanine--tRNA ligase [Armatimonadota bacterium]